jgi:hypothetical protein
VACDDLLAPNQQHRDGGSINPDGLAVPVVDGHQQVTLEFRELPVDLRRGVLHCMTIHHSVGPGKQGKYDWLGILGANR